MTLPQGKTERDYGKFAETSDGKTALRIKLHSDSYTALDGRYVLKAGDTMTGELVITPASGNTALTANKDIILKSGQKLIFDGV